MRCGVLRQTETLEAQTIIPAIADDGSLFPIEKMEAHRRGLLHQAVSVFVFSGGDMLIQRRALGKYHSGGQWANTCCSHPNWGETLQDAAERRLREELGIGMSLTAANALTYTAPVGQGLIEHERVQIFSATADRARLRIVADPDEVMETDWISIGNLQAGIAAHPQNFAPWFRLYIERWSELGL